jgi:hypothetical protein
MLLEYYTGYLLKFPIAGGVYGPWPQAGAPAGPGRLRLPNAPVLPKRQAVRFPKPLHI